MKKTIVERLAARTVVDPATGCHLWTGPLTHNGYARPSGVDRTKRVMAHRLAWEIANGPIPAGLTIDHLCRVRHCINPDHLEAVTIQENLRRGLGTLGRANAAKTHCPVGHEYTPENTYTATNWAGGISRGCRRCSLDRSYRRRHAS